MKYLFRITLFFFYVQTWSQVDYSSRWEDFFSYNYVVDFVNQSDHIYAITENAVFTDNFTSDETVKISSINGLSGSATSSIHYSSTTEQLVIGYENGLLEIIDKEGNVKKIVDIFLSEISAEKKINSFFELDSKLYLAMEFGVVVYSLLDYEFEDTYFIGANSTAVDVKSILISNGFIYAASKDGVYIADVTSNLSDAKNWVKNFSGEFLRIIDFNGDILTSQGNDVFNIVNNTSLELKVSQSAAIVDINSTSSILNVATSKQGFLYDINYALDISTVSKSLTLTSISSDDEFLFLGTKEKGVIRSSLVLPDDYIEIHPDGPVLNELFSMTVEEEDIWVVYGAYTYNYGPTNLVKPVDHFDGEKWVNISIDDLTIDNQTPRDLVKVTVDPSDKNKVYVSSWAGARGDIASIDKGGMLILKNNEYYDFWHSENSGLNSLQVGTYTTTRVGSSIFDEEGNLWVLNSIVNDGSGMLKKLSPTGEWSGHLESGIIYIDEIVMDKSKNIWIGSRDKGMFVYNEGAGKDAKLTTELNGLPTDNVRSIAVGVDDKIWIGTDKGLVLFSDQKNVFNNSFENAEPVIIEEDGIASELLDGAFINDILVDGAGNIWFATRGGVLKTSSNGKEILEGFNKDNSPLPSNIVLDLQIQESTGTMFFGTDKGLVSYKTGVAAFGEKLTDAYAYPNPALKQHSKISIVGKSSNFPEGVNIKILDVAGNLVYESNAVESQSDLGGKFVWDKTNLAGTKVASGVYIVLIYDAENNQTASTKIAIIN